jgi:hypothetical protein
MLVTETLQHKQVVRRYELGLLFRGDLPAAADKFLPVLESALTTMAGLTGSQASAFARVRELARLKQKARKALRENCAAINRIATVVALETPGFDDKFQMPVNGDEKLLAAGRSFVEDAAPLSAVFIKHALPADFLEVLKADIQGFEQAVRNLIDGVYARDAVTATIDAAMKKAIAASKGLDAIVRNTLRDDFTKLDQWDRASEFGRAKPKTKAEAAAAPQAPPPSA